MKNSWTLLPLLFGLLLFSSCSFYSGMHASKASYKGKLLQEDHQIRYSFNFLQSIPHAHNFSERAQKNDIQLIAMEIENFGIVPIELGYTHFLVVDGQAVPLMDSRSIYDSTRRRYKGLQTLLWTTPLFGFLGLANEDIDPNLAPAFFVIGPIIVLTTVIGRALENAQFQNDLDNYNLAGVRIPAGEKVQGIIGVKKTKKGRPKEIWLSPLGRF